MKNIKIKSFGVTLALVLFFVINSFGQWTQTGSILYTNSTTWDVGVGNTSPSNKLSVTGNANFTGNVGIGTATPAYKLDVNGDINAGGTSTTTTSCYLLGTNKFLWHNGLTTNIYAGVNAGNNTSSGSDNAFIGYAAGNSITLGGCNTFVGSNAGKLTTSSARNVFVGCLAGFNNTNTNGGDNTFVGFKAGYSTNGGLMTLGNYGWHNSFYGDEAGLNNTIGNENTGIGAYSLHENLTGNQNACLGNQAGYYNLDNDNVFIGYKAGISNTIGHENTFLGYHSNCGNVDLINASAIGSNAIVENSDQMILGDPYVNVGIGLSGDPTGPRDKLEINSATGCVSGLQFTQLTSACTPAAANPGAGVLAVASDGKVIYVPDGGGGSLNTAVGYFSGGSVSGYGNVCFGSNAGIGVGVCDGNTMVDLT